MQENMKRSAVYRVLNNIWPIVYRIINSLLFFLITGLRNVLRDVFQSLKGG